MCTPPGIDGMKSGRNVEITYRNLTLSNVPVTSLSHEFDLRAAAYIKSEAIRQDLLVEVELEQMLGVLHGPAKLDYGIGEDVLMQAISDQTHIHLNSCV